MQGNSPDEEYTDEHGECAAEIARLQKALDWLSAQIFERKWDGTLGRPSYWQMAGPYRHALQKMRGETLLEAIDAALAKEPKP